MNKTMLTIDISHGTTHDGPGIRTTVFTKGCPLHCIWCQNPESIERQNGVWWSAQDCIGCGCCTNACANDAITLTESGVHIERERCHGCGSCAEACPTTSLSMQGQEYTLDDLLEEVLRDKHYYRQFGGGVTCSGGEPLLQHEVVASFFRRLQEQEITTALDTCGCVPQKHLESVLPFTNYVLFDIKLMDSEQHKRFTGAHNEIILSNLLITADYIRRATHPITLWIRTPLIPDITARLENIRAIGTFIREHLLDVVERWELCAFNGVCAKKYEQLGMTWAFDGHGAMRQSEIDRIRQTACEVVPEEIVLITGMVRQNTSD